MEIGGYDTIYSTDSAALLAASIMEFVNWPDAVIEQAEPGKLNEFFWYENEAAKAKWDADGYDPSSEDDMIYFIFGDHELSVVTDEGLTKKIRAKFGGGMFGANEAS